MASLVEMVALLLAAAVAALLTWLMLSLSGAHIAVIAILVLTIGLAFLSRRQPPNPTWQPSPSRPPSHNVEWARRKLPDDAYEEITNEHRVRCVRLTRDMTIDGVRCKGGTKVYFSLHGELTLATLATDQDIDGLPLAAGSQICWTTEPRCLVTATLRRDTWIHGIPCAAGPLRLHSGYRRHVRKTQLFCEVTVAGMRCQARSRLELDRGLLGYKLRYCVPAEETTHWGLRCAAGKGIDFYERDRISLTSTLNDSGMPASM